MVCSSAYVSAHIISEEHAVVCGNTYSTVRQLVRGSLQQDTQQCRSSARQRYFQRILVQAQSFVAAPKVRQFHDWEHYFLRLLRLHLLSLMVIPGFWIPVKQTVEWRPTWYRLQEHVIYSLQPQTLRVPYIDRALFGFTIIHRIETRLTPSNLSVIYN